MAITPSFYEQIEKFQCLSSSTPQGLPRDIFRTHVARVHVPKNVSWSLWTLRLNFFEIPRQKILKTPKIISPYMWEEIFIIKTIVQFFCHKPSILTLCMRVQQNWPFKHITHQFKLCLQLWSACLLGYSMNRNGIPLQDESPTNVEEVLLTLSSKTEILVLDRVEHEFLSSGDQPMLLFTFRLAQIFTCGLVLGTNVPMIIFTLNQGSKTFLDWLIIFDCFLCLGNLHVLIILIRLSDDDIGFCVFHVFLMFFFNLCNRLLTLGIAIYRFTLVLGSTLVFTTYQKKVLEIFIPLFILVISILLTGWAIYYREDYRHFLGETEN